MFYVFIQSKLDVEVNLKCGAFVIYEIYNDSTIYVTGLVISGNEISQILFSVILSYAGGQRNRPRWLAWGVVFCAMSCFILASPHFIYGPGEDALHLTKEYQQQYAGTSKYLVGIFNLNNANSELKLYFSI